jgi:phosphoribosyl 1,2-cyclic phosphate phosphodiesterase
LKITVLGSGTSQGVPVIACDCHVCKSTDVKDARLRSSILISAEEENFVVDAGPDFRQQMLRANVKTLKGVLFTHEHKDHLGGLDDIRAFNYRENRKMEIFSTQRVYEAIQKEYHYIFSEVRYPGIPEISWNEIQLEPFKLPNGPMVVPIQVMHHKMPVLGFRIADFAYITDAKTISEKELEKVKGTKILIVNALHRSSHISHFNLEEALEFINKVKPQQAYLTHISHLFGLHEEIEHDLPEGVSLAYDGLTIEI